MLDLHLTDLYDDADNHDVIMMLYVFSLSGVSRSVTVLLAYLMKTDDMTLDKAVCRLNQVYSPDKVK
jgi:predicted protein tyrosine phosphatase